MTYPRLPASLVPACFVFLTTAVLLPGQTTGAWSPIPPEELALKDNPASPGAAAMILYRETYTDDTKSFETDYSRIKIFKEEGKKYADIEIPYLEKRLQVEDIRARTVRPDGTAAEFQGQIFDKVVVKARGLKLQVKTFTLPAVEAGSIIEYSFKLRGKEGPPEVLVHPENYVIDGALSFPTAHWDVQRELFTRRARFSIKPVPKATLQWTWFGLPGNNQPRKQQDGTVLLEVENVPAFQEEEYMPPAEMLKSRVHFFYILGFVSSPDSFWSQWGKRRAEAIDEFIGKSKNVARAAAQTVDPNDPSEAKLRKLYARVQQLRYASYENPRTEKEQKREKLSENKNADDVLKHGYGFGNEINFLFVALARAAGFEAWMVQGTTRDSGLFEPTVVDPSQLNDMVVLVRLGSQDLYLDPATRFCPYGLLPWNETGVRGIRLDKNGATLVTTTAPASNSAVVERKARLQLLEDGTLQGKLQVAFIGQEALSRRLSSYDKDEVGRRKAIEEEVKNWLPAGATAELEGVTGWEKSEEPLRADCRVTIPHLATRTGRRMLFPAAIFHANRAHPLQHAQRVHPVYFRFPFQEVDQLTIELPAGFRLESLPAPRKETAEFAGFETSGESRPGTVELQRRFHMDGFAFPMQAYAPLRAFFDKLRTSDEEKLVLQTGEAPRGN